MRLVVAIISSSHACERDFLRVARVFDRLQRNADASAGLGPAARTKLIRLIKSNDAGGESTALQAQVGFSAQVPVAT